MPNNEFCRSKIHGVMIDFAHKEERVDRITGGHRFLQYDVVGITSFQAGTYHFLYEDRS